MTTFIKYKILQFKTKFYLFLNFLIKKLLQFSEFFLFLRFWFKFANANPQTIVVDLIFKGSDFLIYPFNFIFPNFYWRGFFIESTTLAAMLGYLIFAIFVIQVLKIIFQE